MSDASRRLPARPSLEQLRTQAKERLSALRASDPASKLSDAQYALARDYGFDSWPKLVRHVKAMLGAARVEQFERLARDILDGYQGDAGALRRLIAHFGVGYTAEQFHPRVRSRVDDARGEATGEPTLEDTRAVVARLYGFDDWEGLANAVLAPPDRAAGARGGWSSGPPFFRIDAEHATIEVQPPLTDRDWDTVCAVVRERGIQGLRTRAITDGALRRLSRLASLRSLDVRGAGLTDEGLLELSKLPQLEELALGGRITDRGLAVLRDLPRLRRFSAPWMQSVTDAGVAQLRFCDRLEQVDLMGSTTGDGLLESLRGKELLHDLRTGRHVTDAGLRSLRDMPGFTRWPDRVPSLALMTFAPDSHNLLLDGPITDRGLAGLGGLAGVFGLGFFGHENAFTGAGLATLAAMPNLGFLSVPGDRCDDVAMRGISRLPKLRMLLAQGAVATDDGFEALGRSSTLEYLWGRECPNLGGRGFRALATMPALRGLGVSCKGIDDASLAALPRFPSLRQLMPMDVTDPGFRHVGACTGLVDLWCMYCRDTGDEATRHIAELRLETYYAGKTKITDESCRILGRMTSLERIELWECAGITDRGILALAKLPRLKRIAVSGAPRVSRRGLDVFSADVRVEHEG